MKNLMYLFCSLFVFTVISCSSDDDFTLAPDDQAKYHWDHVNPAGVDFTVYQGAAFCGDGYSNQIQIWTATLSECQCLLSNFVDDCNDGITSYTECHAVSSKYPPLAGSDCN